MKRFKARLATVKSILGCLSAEPCRWTPLMRRVLMGSTPWVAQSTLDWLHKEGYVERPSRGLYRLTEKGKLLLDALH